MALAQVVISPEVFEACMTHALTTEKEEVMGLLLGDIMYNEQGYATAHIWIAMPQIRTDRRKDRVEASPEQLAEASSKAEQISVESKRTTRVIGWYHSHPHITVLPSHVDVKTQAMYQNLDEGFIGLIFSAFNQESNKRQRFQVTAFQSMKQGWHSSLTPRGAHWGSQDVDSPMAAAISASVADARSAAASQDQWIQRNVPLAVLPLLDPRDAAGGLIALCRVLFQEEQMAYQKALEDAVSRDGRIDSLAAVHLSGQYQQNLTRLMQIVVSPALQSIQNMQQQSEWQCGQLCHVRDTLAFRIAKAFSHPASPVSQAVRPSSPLAGVSPRQEPFLAESFSRHDTVRPSSSLAGVGATQEPFLAESFSRHETNPRPSDTSRRSPRHFDDSARLSRTSAASPSASPSWSDVLKRPAKTMTQPSASLLSQHPRSAMTQQQTDYASRESQEQRAGMLSHQERPTTYQTDLANLHDASQQDTLADQQRDLYLAKLLYDEDLLALTEPPQSRAMVDYSSQYPLPGEIRKTTTNKVTKSPRVVTNASEWIDKLPDKYQPRSLGSESSRSQTQTTPTIRTREQSSPKANWPEAHGPVPHQPQRNVDSWRRTSEGESTRGNKIRPDNFRWSGSNDWSESATIPSTGSGVTGVSLPSIEVVRQTSNTSSIHSGSTPVTGSPSTTRRALNGGVPKPDIKDQQAMKRTQDAFSGLLLDEEMGRMRSQPRQPRSGSKI